MADLIILLMFGAIIVQFFVLFIYRRIRAGVYIMNGYNFVVMFANEWFATYGVDKDTMITAAFLSLLMMALLCLFQLSRGRFVPALKTFGLLVLWFFIYALTLGEPSGGTARATHDALGSSFNQLFGLNP